MQDRLEPLICRNVIYTVTDSDETYTGTVERDSNGRPYIQDSDGIAIVYDTGILKNLAAHSRDFSHELAFADQLHRKYLGENA